MSVQEAQITNRIQDGREQVELPQVTEETEAANRQDDESPAGMSGPIFEESRVDADLPEPENSPKNRRSSKMESEEAAQVQE